MEDKALTKIQEKFVKGILAGLNQTQAARQAGSAHPMQGGCIMMKLPHVQKAIYERSMSALMGRGLPKAVKTIYGILDESIPARVADRLAAAKYVVDKAEALQNMSSLKDIMDKNPLDMSEAEVAIFIRQGRKVIEQTKQDRQLADLGIIDVTPERLPGDE